MGVQDIGQWISCGSTGQRGGLQLWIRCPFPNPSYTHIKVLCLVCTFCLCCFVLMFLYIMQLMTTVKKNFP